MTTYPIEFHRRLEQKWAGRIEQILTVTCAASRREIPPTTMMMRTKTKRTKTSATNRPSSANPTKTSRYGYRTAYSASAGMNFSPRPAAIHRKREGAGARTTGAKESRFHGCDEAARVHHPDLQRGWPSPQHVSLANTTQLVIPSARTEASRLWPK